MNQKHLPAKIHQNTHIGRFELVDDGGFATVVKAQTKNVDLLLPQAKPG